MSINQPSGHIEVAPKTF